MIRGHGCNALLIRYATWHPLAYATAWCAPHHGDRPEALREAVDRWRTSFADAGITTISGAIVLLRRRSSSTHWRRACSLADIPQGLGPRLPGIVAANDRLASGADPFTTRVRPAPGLEVERRNARASTSVRGSPAGRRSSRAAPSSRPSRRPSCVSTAPARSANYSTTAKQPVTAAHLLELGLLDFADEDEHGLA